MYWIRYCYIFCLILCESYMNIQCRVFHVLCFLDRAFVQLHSKPWQNLLTAAVGTGRFAAKWTRRVHPIFNMDIPVQSFYIIHLIPWQCWQQARSCASWVAVSGAWRLAGKSTISCLSWRLHHRWWRESEVESDIVGLVINDGKYVRLQVVRPAAASAVLLSGWVAVWYGHNIETR